MVLASSDILHPNVVLLNTESIETDVKFNPSVLGRDLTSLCEKGTEKSVSVCTEEDEYPDGGKGWIVVVGVSKLLSSALVMD